MHPHTLTLLVTVTLVLAVLVGLVLGIVGLRLLWPRRSMHHVPVRSRASVTGEFDQFQIRRSANGLATPSRLLDAALSGALWNRAARRPVRSGLERLLAVTLGRVHWDSRCVLCWLCRQRHCCGSGYRAFFQLRSWFGATRKLSGWAYRKMVAANKPKPLNDSPSRDWHDGRRLSSADNLVLQPKPVCLKTTTCAIFGSTSAATNRAPILASSPPIMWLGRNDRLRNPE